MPRWLELGRGLGPGLAALFAAACGWTDPRPVADPVAGYQPPVRETTAEGSRVVNFGPAERIRVYAPDPDRDLTLLFLHGRAATPLPGGGSAWADLEGGRVLTFDSRGRVASVLGGAPANGAPLTSPAFVAIDGKSVWGVEIDGRALRFAGSEPERWIQTGLPGAAVGGMGGVLAATRTVFDIQLTPLAPRDPLLWVSDWKGVRPVGRVRLPDQAMLAPVVNAGWVAPRPDGSVVFASAVRPEVSLYGPRGDLVWIATWPRPGVTEPRFEAVAGTLMPSFRLIQQALAIGPDERVYVLATSGDGGPADRLLVLEPDGTLLREGTVGSEAAIYIVASGHVYTLEPDRAVARTEEVPSPMPFEPFDLPALGGPARVRLADYEGRIVVVNFWASWCAPCRREMPLLDSLASELDPERAVIVGLNEDVSAAAAIDFLRDLGGVSYPIAAGRGKLRDRYGYRGLPFTVVLDERGRLVGSIYGFGTSIEPIRDAIRQALDGAQGEAERGAR